MSIHRPVLTRSGHILARKSLSFARDEEGAMIIWSLFTIIGILIGVGLGIDLTRTEGVRLHMQNTLDRAVLAAADLENDGDAEATVRDYVARSDLPGDIVYAREEGGVNEKIVSASLSAEVGTMIVDIVGRDTLPARAGGTARESITDVEIALVLDNSGSMGWDDNRRLNLLKPAAKDFIDRVVKPAPDGGPSMVSVSIVPFSTQVNAGPTLASALNFSDEHAYSHCAEFPGDSFSSTALDPVEELPRVGHFDIFTWDNPVDTFGVVCPFDSSRHITPWSQNKDALKLKIDAMWAGGNTSIDVAAKWGAAMLDPAFRPALTTLADAGTVDESFRGRPFNYGRENTLKVLVVMSDGQNTEQFRLRPEYSSGLSPVYVDPVSGITSYYDEAQEQYFVFADTDLASEPGGTLQAEPAGGAGAQQVPWVDLWNDMSVAYFARYIKDAAIGGGWNSHYNAVYTQTNSGAKNTRATQICDAARNAGVVVYTIGMDTYGQGDATLEACAGSIVNFFDVGAEEIDEAFSSIARQINMLRLTQ